MRKLLCQTNRIFVFTDDVLERIASIVTAAVEAQITQAVADGGGFSVGDSIAAKVEIKDMAINALYEIAHQCIVRVPRDLPSLSDERALSYRCDEIFDQNLLREF